MNNELKFLIYNTPEYSEFNKTKKINSDFDKEIKKLLEKGGDR